MSVLAARLAADMGEIVRRTVGRDIAVELVAAGPWPKPVDPNQPENALRKTPSSTREARCRGRQAFHRDREPLDRLPGGEGAGTAAGQSISMCVSDNGAAMPPDVVADAFDAFLATKPIGQAHRDARQQNRPKLLRHDLPRRSRHQLRRVSVTSIFIRRLKTLAALSETAAQAMADAVGRSYTVKSGLDIVMSGAPQSDCHVLLAGMAAPYKLLSEGKRQIVRFAFPGDFLDLDGYVGGAMDHSVAALGP